MWGKMRVLVTGGGTGGHVYPALSVLEAFTDEERQGLEVAWVGSADSVEQRIASGAGLPFYAVGMGPIRGANPLDMARSLLAQWRGVLQARTLIKAWHPDVVLSTGGYVSVPLVVAAWTRRCPSLLYLPDLEPGWAVKLLAPLVSCIAVSFGCVARHFRERCVMISGYPVRRALFDLGRRQALCILGLDGDLPVLLVLGGSRGAHSINSAVWASLGTWLGAMQVVHITGNAGYQQAQDARGRLDTLFRERYYPYAYLNEEMPAALVAADLVVARAGAATLGEFPAVGAPAILVPYPYAGEHQRINADYLVAGGAGIILDDGQLASRLTESVLELIKDSDRLASMAKASRQLAAPRAARSLAEVLLALGNAESIQAHSTAA